MIEENRLPPEAFQHLENLAAPELGGAVLRVSDEFFGPAKRMLSAQEPVFHPGRYDQNGKWMDGWESRRKRTPGHDYCVLRICPGVIRGVEIDTRFFTGNYPPEAMLEACNAGIEPDENTPWSEIVPRTALGGGSRHFFTVRDTNSWSFLRLNIYPDGGVARLRVFGEPVADGPGMNREQWTDLVSSAAGGEALECNNMHFGEMSNLLSNHPVANMGDGWETRRRRDAGNDWVILKLGHVGRVCRVEVDTAFFRGNYPARCTLKGAGFSVAAGERAALSDVSADWPVILPAVSLGPDQLHIFERQVRDVGNVSHVRLDIFPDGGIARLHLLGLRAGPA
ncbi:MAG: allantoicase [Lysobacterales bacterium]